RISCAPRTYPGARGTIPAALAPHPADRSPATAGAPRARRRGPAATHTAAGRSVRTTPYP
ncbi:hypothetical protein, partial [Streptomyces sp. MBT62]|uniref:hypothetical protein n=1 Tax=Streptomyces sp. MBT62 TaxID=2800410 RepID=UPI0035ABBCD8